MDDTLAMEDDEEIEEEADAEVDKVLYDLTNGKLGLAGPAQTAPPVSKIQFLRMHIQRLMDFISNRQRSNSKTRKQNALWNSTDNNSAVCSAGSSAFLWT